MKKYIKYVGCLLIVVALVVLFVYDGSEEVNSEDALEGVDADSDGVRDDVEEYIVANYDDEPTQDALMQYARAEQDFILSGGNETLAVEAAHARARSIDCVLSKHDFEDGWEIIKSINYAYLNTEERIRAYLAADSLLGGERFSVTPYDERAAMCE